VVTKNIVQRIELLQRTESDKALRAICIERAKRDPVWWIDTFVVTFNPREKPSILPFVLFPKQRELVRWLVEKRERGEWCDLVKSRYTGASWICCALLVYWWLFELHFAGAIGSRKADLVDSGGNPDSLFEKMRAIIRKLPPWMVPADWEKVSRIGAIINPENKSTITGEAGDQIGRGGRKSVYFLDEAAFIERSSRVIAALSENTDCLVSVSTPNGTTNEFYRQVSSGAFPVFWFSWRDDPRRSEEWYERQKERFAAHTIAQELDMSFTASVEGILIKPRWVSASIDAAHKIEGLASAATYPAAGLDLAGDGENSDKTVLIYRRGCIVTAIEQWRDNPTQTAFRVDTALRNDGIKSLTFDADGIGGSLASTLDLITGYRPYSVVSFHGSGSPSDSVHEYEERTAKEKFKNKRAEAWFNLAERFRKTYEHIEGIRKHELSELISIPNHADLIMQLSQPTVKYTDGGKLLIESKIDLKKRGLSSPDTADSLVYCFWDEGSLEWMRNI
jgi:phage terminase large subunit